MMDAVDPARLDGAVEMWLDIICPWCLIGLTRFERAMARAGVDRPIVLRPFRLHPDWPSDGYDWRTFQLVRGLPDRVFAHVAAVGRMEGFDFDFDRVARVPDTLPLHRLLLAGADAGIARPLYCAFASAYFEAGANLSDSSVIRATALAAGLSEVTILASLADPARLAAVEESEREARRLGAHGVPFFRFPSGAVAYGALAAEEFESLLPRARRQAAK